MHLAHNERSLDTPFRAAYVCLILFIWLLEQYSTRKPFLLPPKHPPHNARAAYRTKT